MGKTPSRPGKNIRQNSLKVKKITGNYEAPTVCGWVWAVAYSNNGSMVAASASDRFVRLWRVSDGKQLIVLKGPTTCITSLAFDRHDSRIICGSVDGYVGVWKVSSGKMLWNIKRHNGLITCVSFSRDGDLVASGSHCGIVQVSDSRTGINCMSTLNCHGQYLLRVTFSRDRRFILSASNLGIVFVWNIQTGENVTDPRTIKDLSFLHNVTFSSNNTHIICGQLDGSVFVQSVKTRKKTQMPKQHRHIEGVNAINSVTARSREEAFRVVSGSHEGFLRVCDMPYSKGNLTASTRTMRTPGSIWSLELSKDGEFIVSGTTNGYVQIWNASTGQMIKILEPNELGSLPFS